MEQDMTAIFPENLPEKSWPMPVLFCFDLVQERFLVVHHIDESKNLVQTREIGEKNIQSHPLENLQFFVCGRTGCFYQFLDWDQETGNVQVMLDQHVLPTHVKWLKNTENF